MASALHPGHNEDAAFLNAAAGIAAVFDGVGGHARGEVASGIGASAAMRLAPDAAELGGAWPLHVLLSARRDLTDTIAREAAQAGVELRGRSAMAATAVAAYLGAGELSVAWCGDARAYAVYEDGSVRLLTRDHGAVDELRREGVLTEEAAVELETALDSIDKETALKMGGQMAMLYNYRNVVRSQLSHGPIDTVRVPSAGLAGVVLTTDGVHDNLTTTSLQETVRAAMQRGGIDAVPAALVEAAAAVGASGRGRATADDITAVAIPARRG